MRSCDEFICNKNKDYLIKKLKRMLFRKFNIKKPPYFIWVANVDGKYVGHVWTCVSPIQLVLKSKKLTIINMIICPAYRKLGIGDALLKHIVKFCKNRGIKIIDFQVKIVDKEVNQFCVKRACRKEAYVYNLDV